MTGPTRNWRELLRSITPSAKSPARLCSPGQRKHGICMSRSQPMIVALKFHAELLVVHQQIAVAAPRHRSRHNPFDLLGHDADIGLIAAVVAEAIEAKAVVQITEKNDVVLQSDIGA